MAATTGLRSTSGPTRGHVPEREAALKPPAGPRRPAPFCPQQRLWHATIGQVRFIRVEDEKALVQGPDGAYHRVPPSELVNWKMRPGAPSAPPKKRKQRALGAWRPLWPDEPEPPPAAPNEWNAESFLAKRGYRAGGHGLRDDQRWTILQGAVASFGVEVVLRHLRVQVALRKGQRNGPTKFAQAIADWELDIARLNKTYR